MPNKVSKEELLEGLKQFKKEIGRTPSSRLMRSEGPHDPSTYKKKFGSWNNALREAGMEPLQTSDPPTEKELIQEIQRINESTFGTPKREDIQEYGKYNMRHYQEEFGSFVIALEEAGIDPTEKQYRFSKLSVPERKRGSQTIKKLRKDGPAASSDLPGDMSTVDRQRGMRKFMLSGGTGKGGERHGVGGIIEPVYYLDDTHSPEEVLKTFFDENPSVLENKPKHGIKLAIRKHDLSWTDSGYDLVDKLASSDLESELNFSKVAVIRCWQDRSDDFEYCFNRSVGTVENISEELIQDTQLKQRGPVWGFSDNHKSIWDQLKPGDGVLFAKKSGLYEYSFRIRSKFKDYSVVKELWAEYENGIRIDGLDSPWPYIVAGHSTDEVSVQQELLSDQFGWLSNNDVVQVFDVNRLSYTEFINRIL